MPQRREPRCVMACVRGAQVRKTFLRHQPELYGLFKAYAAADERVGHGKATMELGEWLLFLEILGFVDSAEKAGVIQSQQVPDTALLKKPMRPWLEGRCGPIAAGAGHPKDSIRSLDASHPAQPASQTAQGNSGRVRGGQELCDFSCRATRTRDGRRRWLTLGVCGCLQAYLGRDNSMKGASRVTNRRARLIFDQVSQRHSAASQRHPAASQRHSAASQRHPVASQRHSCRRPTPFLPPANAISPPPGQPGRSGVRVTRGRRRLGQRGAVLPFAMRRPAQRDEM